MADRRVHIGVVGCGYWAQRHLAAWRDLEGAGDYHFSTALR